LLFVRGDPTALSLPQLAIVGSRRASSGGLNSARAFAAALAASGFAITSGLALGVDGAAHRGALERGKTVAVFGTGIDICYPRQHRNLAQAILDGGGTLVSEFPLGLTPKRENFPQRNRIISGLGLGVLVVEAARGSGSLITARLAMEQGREVFAMPGSVHNPQARGCHWLIREGATLVETVDDIVEHLGGLLAYKGEEAAPVPPAAATDDEVRLLEAMGFDPVSADTLVERTGMAISRLTGILVGLELKGVVENVGGLYLRQR
ncbi:MAG: DNA-processing protein DprA, partial [Bacteroidales bacterium]|nr:DNA-processing protein DprA [Bacteroidales bacterium]